MKFFQRNFLLFEFIKGNWNCKLFTFSSLVLFWAGWSGEKMRRVKYKQYFQIFFEYLKNYILFLTYSKNSICLVTTGLGRCQIFLIIKQCPYWPEFLHIMVSYCFYNCAIQLIRGIFYLYISICWLRVLFCVFWNLHTWSSWCIRGQGSQVIPEWLMYRQSWRPFWTCF